jgi:hypothetical protein
MVNSPLLRDIVRDSMFRDRTRRARAPQSRRPEWFATTSSVLEQNLHRRSSKRSDGVLLEAGNIPISELEHEREVIPLETLQQAGDRRMIRGSLPLLCEMQLY